MQSAAMASPELNLVLMVGGVVAGIGLMCLAAIAAYLGWLQRTPVSQQ